MANIRGWFTFSIKDILFVTLISAILLGTYLERQNQQVTMEALSRRHAKEHADILSDYFRVEKERNELSVKLAQDTEKLTRGLEEYKHSYHFLQNKIEKVERKDGLTYEQRDRLQTQLINRLTEELERYRTVNVPEFPKLQQKDDAPR